MNLKYIKIFTAGLLIFIFLGSCSKSKVIELNEGELSDIMGVIQDNAASVQDKDLEKFMSALDPELSDYEENFDKMRGFFEMNDDLNFAVTVSDLTLINYNYEQDIAEVSVIMTAETKEHEPEEDEQSDIDDEAEPEDELPYDGDMEVETYNYSQKLAYKLIRRAGVWYIQAIGYLTA